MDLSHYVYSAGAWARSASANAAPAPDNNPPGILFCVKHCMFFKLNKFHV